MNDFKLMEDEKFIKTIDNDNLKNRYLLLGFDYLGYKFYKCLSIEDNFGNLRNSSVGISYTFNDYFERSNKNLIDNLI
ncbi:hypothetical protein [Wocania ichthyoenteri]|uniref:hypothetical protein n=1 Tax=Wocania ichthyoenteri TaxID=1230531 RepID=UPI00053EF54E|nr:hypothetical protein [Wocania ichthyoenteri]